MILPSLNIWRILTDSIDKQSSFDAFVRDVEYVIQGKYDNNSIEYPQSHFTVLPILCKELSERGCMYPMYNLIPLLP